MQSSIVLLAYWILSCRLVLTKPAAQLDEQHLTHRSHSTSETMRSSVRRDYAPTSGHSASGIQSLNNAGLYGAAPVPVAQNPTVIAPSQPAIVPVSSSPTCNKSSPKSEINRFLIECEAKLQPSVNAVQTYVAQVTPQTVQQIASQIVVKLKEIENQLKATLSHVQSCGMDSKPLSTNKGVALSDVSWSAFQVVLTLKGVFESITALYNPFPAVKTMCSDVLLTLSTGLASLIGACGEQINLFDTRFFPLVTPQLEEFKKVEDNFISFVGTFVS